MLPILFSIKLIFTSLWRHKVVILAIFIFFQVLIMFLPIKMACKSKCGVIKPILSDGKFNGLDDRYWEFSKKSSVWSYDIIYCRKKTTIFAHFQLYIWGKPRSGYDLNILYQAHFRLKMFLMEKQNRAVNLLSFFKVQFTIYLANYHNTSNYPPGG